jgi:hypothetical protein
MEKSLKLVFVFISVASLVLSMPAAMATYVYSEYAGSGDFKMTSSITSDVTPTIRDTVESHTACAGQCCGECCSNDCFGTEPGGYSGGSFLTNEEGSLAVDYGEVTNGCISLNQQTVEQKSDEGQTITTNYYTGVNGTGYVYTWISAVPFNTYSFQYANGSITTWAFFNQLNQFNGAFGFEALFGGGTYNCNSGYIIMENEYKIGNSPMHYGPTIMRMVCLDPGFSYATVFGNATNLLNAQISSRTSYSDWLVDTNINGQAELSVNTNSNDGLEFDFNMTLG